MSKQNFWHQERQDKTGKATTDGQNQLPEAGVDNWRKYCRRCIKVSDVKLQWTSYVQRCFVSSRQNNSLEDALKNETKQKKTFSQKNIVRITISPFYCSTPHVHFVNTNTRLCFAILFVILTFNFYMNPFLYLLVIAFKLKVIFHREAENVFIPTEPNREQALQRSNYDVQK